MGCPDHPDAVDLEDQPKAESEDRKAFISAMIDVILQTQDPAALRCTLRAPSGSPATAAGPECTFLVPLKKFLAFARMLPSRVCMTSSSTI